MEDQDRPVEALTKGLDEATPEAPFLMSRSELVKHVETLGSTGCGGYSTVATTDGKRDVAWDYACKD